MKRALLLNGVGVVLDVAPVGAEFPVHPSLVWVDCADDAAPGTHEWNGSAVAVRVLTPAQIAAQAKAAALATDAATLKADGALIALLRMTPAQIDAWCAANITDMASARNAIRLLARAVSVIARAQIDQ